MSNDHQGVLNTMSEASAGNVQHSSSSTKPAPQPQPTSMSSSPASNSVTLPSQLFTRSSTSQSTRVVNYTTFTARQKHLITLLLGVTTLASPLTATIYFPLIPLLRAHFHTSAQAINLTITVYIIFQALSPAFFATLSDSLGRRPIYLVTFTVYFLASLGLALNKDSYAALLVLRAVQSVGASAVLAIAYGVIADVCVPAERGSMLAPVLAATNLGPCIGPVIGGWVALGSGGFHWVFWSLTIFGLAVLATIGMVFPETGRNIVMNGSVPATGWGRSWCSISRSYLVRWRVPRTKAAECQNTPNEVVLSQVLASEKEKRNFKIAKPLTCLRIIFWRDTALVLWICASFYAVWYCVQTSIPSIYKDIYHFNELMIGLSYLTGGAGVILGGFVTGKLMDRNYTITAKKSGCAINTISGDDMNHFPIEKARARGSWYLITVFIFALGAYGWTIQAHAHPSIPLILQSVVGFICTCFLQTFSALLVDIFPESPGTAAASNNLTRCALSALAIAVLQPLIDVMGRGWYFSLLSFVTGIGGTAAVWAIQTRGQKWRAKRLLKTRKIHSSDNSRETRLSQIQSMEDKNQDSLTLPIASKTISRAGHVEEMRPALT